MKIAILQERAAGEQRVAATPDSVKKFVALGATVAVEKGAGVASAITDDAYAAQGATLVDTPAQALEGAAIVLTVRLPEADILKQIPKDAFLIGMLAPYDNRDALSDLASVGLNAVSLEMLPRISRAQSMDVLSSQSNLAGYRAVIDAVATFGKAVPMMMTAAGTVAPAKALILGAGVAGLQAIATAKRLGAVVSAFDVRPVVKEQVESLGAKFIEVPAEEGAETSGGYAKEMSEDYKKKQSALIHETLKKTDLVITTALIPGKPAPVLITEEMVADMKPGAVIVDLAVAAGGNCPLSKPEEIVNVGGVAIIGYANMPSRVAVDASNLYARNLYNYVSALLIDEGKLNPKWEDELLVGTLLTRDGKLVHSAFAN